METGSTLAFTTLLAALQALAEPTRLRLAVLLSETELTVTELTTILGQSQPRVSRHLKMMVDAGLLLRHREGAWVFFALDRGHASAGLVHAAMARVDIDDAVLAGDRARLDEVRLERARAADRYFATHAADWTRIRALHVADESVERLVLDTVGQGPFRAVLDLGTGTGRMLELLSDRAERAVGIDASPAMLAVARARIEQAGLRNVQLRHGDIYAVPVEQGAYDVVVIHQVLHFLDDPSRAVREAARALRPGGRLVVVDFAPHAQEFLRAEHAHRRLGFAADEVAHMIEEAGLEPASHADLPPAGAQTDRLTVSIWVGRDPRILSDQLITPRLREIA